MVIYCSYTVEIHNYRIASAILAYLRMTGKFDTSNHQYKIHRLNELEVKMTSIELNQAYTKDHPSHMPNPLSEQIWVIWP
jgi:hypothetical protein